jgi:hypothetical protein
VRVVHIGYHIVHSLTILIFVALGHCISEASGILLSDPSGCGKTLLVQILAARARVNFGRFKKRQILNGWVHFLFGWVILIRYATSAHPFCTCYGMPLRRSIRLDIFTAYMLRRLILYIDRQKIIMYDSSTALGMVLSILTLVRSICLQSLSFSCVQTACGRVRLVLLLSKKPVSKPFQSCGSYFP